MSCMDTTDTCCKISFGTTTLEGFKPLAQLGSEISWSTT